MVDKAKKILIIGSCGLDMNTFIRKMPSPGETIQGIKFCQNLGGKGQNQAVAVARSGGEVAFLGAVGKDDNGKFIQNSMKENNIKAYLKEVEGVSCGIATILIDEQGENRIVIIAGANGTVDKAQIDANINLIDEYDIIMLQLEIPVETVEYVIDIAYEKKKIIILNPAPGKDLKPETLQKVTYLTPNETELGILTKMPFSSIDEIKTAGQKLIDLGVKNLLVTIGAKGVYLMNKDLCKVIPTFQVKPVDTTAAGDCFNGVFATYLAKGCPLEKAIRYANLAASISVTRVGAVPSLPTEKEIEDKNKTIKDFDI